MVKELSHMEENLVNELSQTKCLVLVYALDNSQSFSKSRLRSVPIYSWFFPRLYLHSAEGAESDQHAGEQGRHPGGQQVRLGPHQRGHQLPGRGARSQVQSQVHGDVCRLKRDNDNKEIHILPFQEWDIELMSY